LVNIQNRLMTFELETKKVEKGTIILRAGEVSNYCFKVLKGCLKSFVFDNTGREHILQFAPENWWISDLDSFLNNKPSGVFIVALEDSEVVYFDKADYANLKNLPNSELLEEINLLTNNIISQNKRLILLLSSTGEERYLTFIQTYPNLTQRLPLKLIASYVGVTPEHLSYLRKKIAQK